MPTPAADKTSARVIPSLEGRPTIGFPEFNWLIYRKWWTDAKMFSSAPIKTNAMPIGSDNADGTAADPACVASISRRNNPNRAMTKPNAINAKLVRIHAKNVRSAARYTRGSCCTFSLAFSNVFPRKIRNHRIAGNAYFLFAA